MGCGRRLGRLHALPLAAAALALACAGTAAALPPAVEAELQQAQVPPQALAVVVQEVGAGRTLLAAHEQLPVNPASLFKLVTTLAALEQLGPAWTWRTPVWLNGPVERGVLDGDLVIRGSGDPKLVQEQVWLLLRRVQQLGVREIRGDVVLDRSAFAPPAGTSSDFDGEPSRPYNVLPDALLLNYKSVLYTFVPDAARGVAQVLAEPALARTRTDLTVPLAQGPCVDLRAALRPSLAEPGRVRFEGRYPAGCGEQTLALADAEPSTYNARLVESLWRELGGRLRGRVRDGAAPVASLPAFEWKSPPLAEVVREINKFSNNVMAQQLFLSLPAALDPTLPASPERSRASLQRWLGERGGELAAGAVVDNGSGLSRTTRVSAALLARLLQHAFAGSLMPELAASLPSVGIDGTLRRMRVPAGRAHLKSGSMRDVVGLAGYVLGDSGRRYVLVAIVNHPNAQAARPALDALLQWTMRDGVAR